MGMVPSILQHTKVAAKVKVPEFGSVKSNRSQHYFSEFGNYSI